MTAENQRTLDVRELDGEPFGDILAALDALEEGNRLLLINSFEPKPLYDVLERRGFTYEATAVEPDRWEIRIEHA